MSFRLAGADLEGLKAALELFNTALKEHGVNLCAYGGIDVEVGDGGYLRLVHVADFGYVFEEQFR